MSKAAGEGFEPSSLSGQSRAFCQLNYPAFDTRREIRTHTHKAAAFETAVSTIPPDGLNRTGEITPFNDKPLRAVCFSSVSSRFYPTSLPIPVR